MLAACFGCVLFHGCLYGGVSSGGGSVVLGSLVVVC
jgi:hypothetical protein